PVLHRSAALFPVRQLLCTGRRPCSSAAPLGGDGVPVTQRLPRGWVPSIARHQGGLFTAAQAIAGGATRAQVRRRRETGQWVTLLGDALALPSVESTIQARSHAAALTWPDAVICLRAAAVLH